jgi:formylglycine-generating enzyme required for sulfatase activity
MTSTVALALALALAPSLPVSAAAQSPYVESVPGTLVSFEMIPIAGGSVTVGTGEAARSVEVGPFWIAKTEVTWDLYDVYVYELDRTAPRDARVDAVSRPSRPYVLPGDEFGHEGMPALGMTLHAARQFAAWLSARTGRRYRVPTEAEWEHACRLGTAGVDPATIAWTAADSDSRTHEVASKEADAAGLHDILGNVAEWVTGIDGDSVAKGGNWERSADAASCASRLRQVPAWRASDPQLPKSRWWLTDAPFVGLRVIREPDDSPIGGTK